MSMEKIEEDDGLIKESEGEMFKNKIDMVKELSSDADPENAENFDIKNPIAQELIHTVADTKDAAKIVRGNEEEDYEKNTEKEIAEARKKLEKFFNSNEGRSEEIKKRPVSENMEVE